MQDDEASFRESSCDHIPRIDRLSIGKDHSYHWHSYGALLRLSCRNVDMSISSNVFIHLDGRWA